MKCQYCLKPRTGKGWHDCEQATRSRRRLANALSGIHELMVGGLELADPLDRRQYREEQQNCDNMRTLVRINKGELKRGIWNG